MNEEIEITPEMIEAGEAFIDEKWGGRSPRFENLLPDFLSGLFRAMAAEHRSVGFSKILSDVTEPMKLLMRENSQALTFVEGALPGEFDAEK